MKETIAMRSREIQRIQALEQVCRGIRTLVGSIPLLPVSYRFPTHVGRVLQELTIEAITAAERYLKVSFAYEATVANDNTGRLGGHLDSA
jgi:hypothetical protein